MKFGIHIWPNEVLVFVAWWGCNILVFWGSLFFWIIGAYPLCFPPTANAGANKAASSSTSLNTRKLDEETENLSREYMFNFNSSTYIFDSFTSLEFVEYFSMNVALYLNLSTLEMKCKLLWLIHSITHMYCFKPF